MIEEAPILRSAEMDGLYLDGSSLPGLLADRVSVRGGVFLRGAQAGLGELRLRADLGARIDGNLELPICLGATLEAGNGALCRWASGRGERLSQWRVQGDWGGAAPRRADR